MTDISHKKKRKKTFQEENYQDSPSWGISHLPVLNELEITAFFDLFKAWFQNRPWELPENVNLNLLSEYADRHGFNGMIHILSNKKKINYQYNKSSWDQRYFTNLLYHQKCMNICYRIQDIARNIGIPMAIIKGPGLTINGYLDPGIRSYSDIDIIVESIEHALKLISTLGCTWGSDHYKTGFRQRFLHPGRIHTSLNGWELEFCYFVKSSREPLFDLIQRHKKRFLKIPAPSKRLSTPEPNLHVVILIQHMAYHLCARLIWFFDIIVFERHNRKQLDWFWIEKELATLQLANIAFLISQFCRKHLSQDFPLIGTEKSGWNSLIQRAIVSTDQIFSKISLYHKKGWRKYFSFILAPARFFFITDPTHHSLFKKNLPTQWMASRLLFAMGIRGNFIFHFFATCIFIFGFPLVRILEIIWVHIDQSVHFSIKKASKHVND